MAIDQFVITPPEPTRPFRPSGFVLSKLLAATTAENFTVPAGAKYVRFAATSDFFTLYGTTQSTATVPGDVTDGTACELVKSTVAEWRHIPSGVTGISVISSSTPIVTASFWTE